MKMNQPIGNSIYAPLILRIALGSYFVIAGMELLSRPPEAVVQEVQSYGIMPEQLATLYAVLLPYLELVGGGLTLLGMYTTLAGILVSIVLLSFIWINGVFLHSSNLFNRDVILLACALSLMYSGGGAFSIDRFRQNA
ncbi:MAG: DoxX family protein [Candidatus Dadabacteria bacterium]|nr:MAG: DoxX family protein [Candidatus Dadabacteria bacterium]